MYEMLFKLAIETLMHCSVFLIVISCIMSCCTIAYVSRLFKVLKSNIQSHSTQIHTIIKSTCREIKCKCTDANN